MRLVVAVVLMGASASVSDATVYNFTFTGTLAQYTYDNIGYFGAARADIGGSTFIANFLLDDQISGSGPRFGSGIFGTGASDPLTSSLTVNSKTYVFPKSNGGGNFNNGQWFLNEYSLVNGGTANSIVMDLFNFQTGMPPLPLAGDSITFAISPRGFPQTGYFQQQNSFRMDSQGYTTSGFFNSIALTVTAIASVPEPASWTMMIGGFGLIGGALRRKKAAERLVAA